MQPSTVPPPELRAPQAAPRLHYLDWLRVIAILGVFLFHAVHAFDLTDWEIKNAEQSMALTVVIVLFGLWGMPLFFLIAGTGSWFALRRRPPTQYASERFKRLFIPFIVGSILFSPIMMYLEWANRVARGQLQGPFIDFALNRNVGFSPRWFGSLGYHLWFRGFLFCFALITLPFFTWLKRPSGLRLLDWLARLCEHRGGVLLFMLAFLPIQLGLRPVFPIQHDWGDFVYLGAFFALGYVLYADARFAQAIRRDGWIIGAAALAALALLLATFGFGDPFDWAETPAIPQFYLIWSLITANAVYWTLFVLFVGMRFLDFSNAALRYGQEAVLPFFVVHQPVIFVIAFFVVQWSTGIPVKMLAVLISSFAVSVGLYEFVIRRIGLLRAAFGMTSRPPDRAANAATIESAKA